MTVDPLAFVDDIAHATDRLLATAAALDDAAVAAPSPLPGWTRGHVLTHIARNADGAVNLLTWARTGVETPQYASWEQRASDIEAGAHRSAAALRADLEHSCARLAEALAQMTPAAWAAQVRWTDGRTGPAAQVAWTRLREVELHHVDLGAGYTPLDWPEAFAIRLAKELTQRANRAAVTVRAPEVGHDLEFEPGGPVVSGPIRAVVGWLTGRGDGAGLQVRPAGPLPPVPPFG